MMLYDIFYADRSMDTATRLPHRAERGAVARNVGWDGHLLIARCGKWVEAHRDAATGKIIAKEG